MSIGTFRLKLICENKQKYLRATELIDPSASLRANIYLKILPLPTTKRNIISLNLNVTLMTGCNNSTLPGLGELSYFWLEGLGGGPEWTAWVEGLGVRPGWRAWVQEDVELISLVVTSDSLTVITAYSF